VVSQVILRSVSDQPRDWLEDERLPA
jgi:hypothetical protein